MKSECQEADVKSACILCNSTANDEFKYGKKYKYQEIVCPYYCLLFACGLEQNGEDEEGILGFMRKDILREASRGKKLRCTFCRKTGATSACCLKKCRVMFHFGCGLENRVLNQYTQDFSTYCEKHRPRQNMSQKYLREHMDDNCAICLLPIKIEQDPNGYEFIKTPCCNLLLHRVCVQKQALNAGYFFKCPLCNNTKEFTHEMQKFGVFVPEQDASWELEDNAYGDLYFRYNRCDADPCECPRGREYDKAASRWDIAICRICASHGAHVQCGRIRDEELDSWVCPVCSNIENENENSKKRKLSETTNNYDYMPSSSSQDETKRMKIKRTASDHSPAKASPQKLILRTTSS